MSLEPLPIAALSLYAPFGDLIAIGEKTIETRIWKTRHRGWLLLCQGKRARANEERINKNIEFAQKTDICKLLYRDYPLLAQGYIPRFGVAVAVAWLEGCYKMGNTEKEIYHSCVQEPEDLWGWYLEDILPIDPFEVKGQRNVFEVKIPPSRVRQIPYRYRDPIRRNQRLPIKEDKTDDDIPQIFTIGYAGRSKEEINLLMEEHNCSILIDVRRKPYSKNAAFQAANLFQFFGDSYQSMVKLGNQKFCLPWRRPPRWEEDMSLVAKMLQKHSVMLMCAERHPYQCHRRDVALFLSAITGGKIIHF